MEYTDNSRNGTSLPPTHVVPHPATYFIHHQQCQQGQSGVGLDADQQQPDINLDPGHSYDTNQARSPRRQPPPTPDEYGQQQLARIGSGQHQVQGETGYSALQGVLSPQGYPAHHGVIVGGDDKDNGLLVHHKRKGPTKWLAAVDAHILCPAWKARATGEENRVEKLCEREYIGSGASSVPKKS